MEYHSDRFDDYSLIILENQNWIAILPGNRVGTDFFSHQGLSYGGLVYNEKQKLSTIITVFQKVLLFLNQNNIANFHVKIIPSIYPVFPSDEFLYILFLTQAKLVRRDSLSVIDLSNKNSISSGRLEGVKKGEKYNLVIKEVSQFDDFWNEILIPNLNQKHQAKPVHTLDEISKLKRLFPENIRQFNVYHNETIVAGTTIFETQNVAHAQYISGNESKSEYGSLDFLYHNLITKVFKNKKYFDFGTSNENQGKKLNAGLSFWKESFGASTITQDFYEVETKNFKLLDDVLI